MNRENLKAMADFIERIPEKDFNMGFFRMYGEDYDKPECGSVGCVIGHCTALDEEAKVLMHEDGVGCIDFFKGSELFTGISTSDLRWDYLFGSEWKDMDNTPTGAAKRIRWALKNGFPDKTKIEQQLGGLIWPEY